MKCIHPNRLYKAKDGSVLQTLAVFTSCIAHDVQYKVVSGPNVGSVKTIPATWFKDQVTSLMCANETSPIAVAG